MLSLLNVSEESARAAVRKPTANDVINVRSPGDGVTVSSAFIVTASSRPAIAGASIEGMIIWLDGVQYGPIVRSSTFSLPVTATPGAHVFSVSAWDNAGATGFSPNYSITVVPSSPPSAPPAATPIQSSPTATSPAPTPTLAATPAPTPTASASYYVAQNGSDGNPGTLAEPWLTVQHAMNNATPGSIVNIRAGTYHERLSLNVAGTQGNYITFQPYGFNVPSGGCGGYTGVTCGGEQVVLDYTYLGTVTDGTPLLKISGRHYARIQGLTFQNLTCNGAMQQGIRVDQNSSYIEFNENRFLRNKNVHPAFDGTAALLFFRTWQSDHITVNRNEFGNINTVMSEVLTTSDGSTNTLVENNYVHDTDGIAISAWSGANNFSFIGNKAEYIGIRRDGTVWYDNPAVAIYSDGGYTGTIARNVVSHAGVGYEALSEPGQPNTHDITISGNIADNCVSAGVVIGTWYSDSDGSSVYNLYVTSNDFYNNNVGIQIRPMTSATVTWMNNIVANNRTNYFNPLNWSPGESGYNLYYGSNVGPGSNNLSSDPLFKNAAAGDLSLQPTSPAINAASPNAKQCDLCSLDLAGNNRIQGGRMDIGAYEAK